MDKTNDRELADAKGKRLASRLDAVGWGLFFIWIGVAFLADLGWGVGLIGVGLIILGTSAAGEFLTRSNGSGEAERKSCSWPGIE